MSDIVIDTNVFLHAEDPRQPRNEAASDLIELLLSTDIEICVDEGFSLTEADNRSFVGNEYIRHIRIGSLGYALLLSKSLTKQLKIVEVDITQKERKIVNRLIRSKEDRIFVKIALSSDSMLLASHDFGDIPQASRDALQFELDLIVTDAGGAKLLIS